MGLGCHIMVEWLNDDMPRHFLSTAEKTPGLVSDDVEIAVAASPVCGT